MSTAMLRSALDVLGETPLPSRTASTLKLAVYSRTVRPKSHLRSPRDAGRRRRRRRTNCSPRCANSTTPACDLIWVEEPPEGPEWDGVRDRLQRAAAA